MKKLLSLFFILFLISNLEFKAQQMLESELGGDVRCACRAKSQQCEARWLFGGVCRVDDDKCYRSDMMCGSGN